jgi:hypothetical protein
MRIIISFLALLLLVSVAWAEKPALKPALENAHQQRQVPCVMEVVTHDWDFNLGPHGFSTAFCDEAQPSCNTETPWEWGISDYIEAHDPVWGTVLEGDYANNSGQALISPSFMVTEESYLVEVTHFYQTENDFDGCNLKVQGSAVLPIGGYPGVISSNTNYYACCVDGEVGWTGDSVGWRTDCFDLSMFYGYEIFLEFEFGSDESQVAPGWYISRVKVGGEMGDRVCCYPQDGHCELTPDWLCEESGGIWIPELESCDPNPCPQPCVMDIVSIDWNFDSGDHGFGEVDCDDGGGLVWEYGWSTHIPSFGSTWGTILNSDYPNNSGAGLVSPSFTVTDSTKIVEILHYFDTEYGWDGCNVSLGVWPNSTIIHPVAGYTIQQISQDPGHYAFCVDNEPGWTGASGWRIDCFDLSPYVGQTVNLELDFGSDDSYVSAGWYISRIRVGGMSTPAFEPIVTAGPWFDPEPWNDWIGTDSPEDDTLRVPLHYYDPDPLNEITHVSFEWDSLGHWTYIGTDFDGDEPWFDTSGHAQPVGTGWSVVASIPLPPPEPALRVRAIPHGGVKGRGRANGEVEVDPSASWGRSGLSDWETHDEDTLGVPINPNGSDIDYVTIYLRNMIDAFDKGVPGINQQGHGVWHCAPTATAQCLKWFEQELGDTDITGGLSDHELVDALAEYFGTNQGPEPGTYISEWIGGLQEWIRDYGAGYTMRSYKHYDDFGWTWTENDWKRMRDELQREQDVLLGIFWEVGENEYEGGHVLTFNSIDNEELPNGHIVLDFKDPWTGGTVYGELDPATGRLSGLGGAGGGGAAKIGATLVVCPREIVPGNWGPYIPVYEGPNTWPEPIKIYVPDLGTYFIDQVIVNALGNAQRITNIIVRVEPNAVPEDDGVLPDAFFLSRAAPNPFRGTTTIAYAVPTKDHIRIEVFDVTGRKVKTLLDRSIDPGFHTILWDGRDEKSRVAAAGVYFVKMRSSTFEQSRGLTLLR